MEVSMERLKSCDSLEEMKGAASFRNHDGKQSGPVAVERKWSRA